jgi:AcrR family transcriptional regulator
VPYAQRISLVVIFASYPPSSAVSPRKPDPRSIVGDRNYRRVCILKRARLGRGAAARLNVYLETLMSRPRKATDDEIFAAAMRVMSRFGPTQLTLSHVATEAGLTAGALVQRFGSKRALLLALMERFSGTAPQMFESLRAASASPLAAIHAYGECLAQMGETPDALARHLAWLQQDLTDPDFRKFMLVQARATRRELQRLVRDAVGAGELESGVDAAALARIIEVTVSGSLMSWAVHQEGPAVSWVRQDLDAVLEHSLVNPKRTAKRKVSAS